MFNWFITFLSMYEMKKRAQSDGRLGKLADPQPHILNILGSKPTVSQTVSLADLRAKRDEVDEAEERTTRSNYNRGIIAVGLFIQAVLTWSVLTNLGQDLLDMAWFVGLELGTLAIMVIAILWSMRTPEGQTEPSRNWITHIPFTVIVGAYVWCFSKHYLNFEIGLQALTFFVLALVGTYIAQDNFRSRTTALRQKRHAQQQRHELRDLERQHKLVISEEKVLSLYEARCARLKALYSIEHELASARSSLGAPNAS